MCGHNLCIILCIDSIRGAGISQNEERRGVGEAAVAPGNGDEISMLYEYTLVTHTLDDVDDPFQCRN